MVTGKRKRGHGLDFASRGALWSGNVAMVGAAKAGGRNKI
jgi:hypothetical protein